MVFFQKKPTLGMTFLFVYLKPFNYEKIINRGGGY
jgi:hypothetical protein